MHGVGQFNGLTNEGSITLINGSTTQITFDNKKLSGTVDFDWKVAFDADHGGDDLKMADEAIINLPFALDLPLVLGPIPLELSFKTDIGVSAGIHEQDARSRRAPITPPSAAICP